MATLGRRAVRATGRVARVRIRHWRDQQAASKTINAALTPDQIDRVSYLLGIYKAVHILFPGDAQADRWIRRANSAPGFEGRSALEVMLRGPIEDLRFVRRYLEDACQH